LRKGEFGTAAQGFLSEVKRAGPRFSVQVLVACSTDTIQKAIDRAPSDELFILPVNYHGKSCYRMCWGLYDSADRATAAMQSMPAYFRQGGATPKVSPAAALLP
jgi:septal ring-binding cell division protein DamX